jgi:NEDD8-activating enzyme E1 regulatory subunit
LANDANAKLIEQPLSLLPIYLALQATSFTGEPNEDEILEDIRKVVPALMEADDEGRITRIAQEVARARSGELHNISALTGGMVAQEVIKIITKQYIPVDNTCIFDGISSRCQVLRL